MFLKEKINNLKLSIKQQNQSQTLDSFDQTNINMSIQGGKSQLYRILVTCTWLNSSINIRSPQLSCKWFNKTDIDIKQIVGVSGCTYQPSFADIGTTIHIQCNPILPGIQYEGMPIIKQIGPILLDPQTQEEAQDLLNAKKATFFVQISKSKKLDIDQKAKCDALLKINGSILELSMKKFGQQPKQLAKININDVYPQINISRADSRQITVIFNSEQSQTTIDFVDHKVRDVFLLLMKLIVGNQYLQKQSQSVEQSTLTLTKQSSAVDLINLGELKKQIKQLQQDKNQLNRKLNQQQYQKEQLQSKYNQTQERLSSLNKNYLDLQGSIAKQKKQENTDKQQLSYYKNQYKKLKIINKQSEQKNKLLQNQILIIKAELNKYKQLQIHYSYHQLVNQLAIKEKQIQQQKLMCSYLYQQNQKLQNQIQKYQQQLNSTISQKNYLKKKYQSLLRQKNINLSAHSSPIKSQVILEKSFDSNSKIQKNSQQDLQKERERLSARQAQILNLKKQVRQLVNQNDFIRTLNLPQKKSSKTQLKMDLLETKKIVNKLTQTIAQKDIALVQMRSINRQLSNRLKQLTELTSDNIGSKSSIQYIQ